MHWQQLQCIYTHTAKHDRHLDLVFVVSRLSISSEGKMGLRKNEVASLVPQSQLRRLGVSDHKP